MKGHHTGRGASRRVKKRPREECYGSKARYKHEFFKAPNEEGRRSHASHLEGAGKVLSERKREEAENGHCRLHHDELQRGLLGQAEQNTVPTNASQAAKRERVRNLPGQKT